MDLEQLFSELSGYIPIIFIGFFVLPGIAYYLSPQRKTTQSKFSLFLKSTWLAHSIFVVPAFLIAILTQAIDFWFMTKVAQTWSSKGLGGQAGGLTILYFYFIFYLSIFVGPLIIIEKRIHRQINRPTYAIFIVWFWIAIYFAQQLIFNFRLVSVQLFPVDNDINSQWLLVGFIILTTIAVNRMSKGLSTDLKDAWTSKKREGINPSPTKTKKM